MTTGGGLFGGDEVFSSLFTDIFEEDDLGRQAIFNSFAPQGQSLGQSAQFQNLYQPAFGQYLGKLGEQVRNNQAPDMRFTDFLEGGGFNAQRGQLQQPDFSFGGSGLGPTMWNFGGR